MLENNGRIAVVVGVETYGAKPIKSKAAKLWDLYKQMEPQYMMNAPQTHYFLKTHVAEINAMSDERYQELVLKIKEDVL